jgi:hypothetical protein
MKEIKKYYNDGKFGEKEITILAKALNKGKFDKVEKYLNSLENIEKVKTK